MNSLQEILNSITPVDETWGEKAQARLDNLTKPPGSLGRLEEIARALCAMKGTDKLVQPTPGCAVFAGDHGITKAGVSPFPSEVTTQMIHNFLAGGAGINAICRQVGAKVKVVDVGVASDLSAVEGLIQAKVAFGTKNMLEEPAMTRDEAEKAMLAGAKVAEEFIAEGCDLLVPGDMGIGNTTPSAAIAAVFTGLSPKEVTGRGAGLDDEGLGQKAANIQKALEARKPDAKDPLGVMALVGGLELAAICGFALMGAAKKVPVILDGMISTAGCITAAHLSPAAKGYFLPGHASVEIGQRAMLENMGLKPLLDLNLRLGEGTGGALAINLVRAAVAIYSEMATFDEAGVTGETV